MFVGYDHVVGQRQPAGRRCDCAWRSRERRYARRRVPRALGRHLRGPSLACRPVGQLSRLLAARRRCIRRAFARRQSLAAFRPSLPAQGGWSRCRRRSISSSDGRVDYDRLCLMTLRTENGLARPLRAGRGHAAAAQMGSHAGRRQAMSNGHVGANPASTWSPARLRRRAFEQRWQRRDPTTSSRSCGTSNLHSPAIRCRVRRSRLRVVSTRCSSSPQRIVRLETGRRVRIDYARAMVRRPLALV